MLVLQVAAGLVVHMEVAGRMVVTTALATMGPDTVRGMDAACCRVHAAFLQQTKHKAQLPQTSSSQATSGGAAAGVAVAGIMVAATAHMGRVEGTQVEAQDMVGAAAAEGLELGRTQSLEGKAMAHGAADGSDLAVFAAILTPAALRTAWLN